MLTERTRFGKSKLGGGQATLIAASLALGIGVAAIFSVIVANTVLTENKPLAIALFLAFTAPILCATFWALLVDRSTVAGAIDKPEDSIESRWYSQAAEDTLHTGLYAIGILGVASVFIDYSVNLGTAVMAVGIFQMVVFGIAYRVRKRKES